MKEPTSAAIKLPPLNGGVAPFDNMSDRKLGSVGSSNHLSNFLEQANMPKPRNTQLSPMKEPSIARKEGTRMGKLVFDGKMNASRRIMEHVLPVAKHKTVLVGMKNTSLDESNTIKKINWKSLREPTDLYYDTTKLLKQTTLNKSLFELYCWAARNTQVQDINKESPINNKDIHSLTKRRKTVNDTQAVPIPFLCVDGQKYEGEQMHGESKAIDARLKKFTRAQWKTPGEISILLGKEKNKQRSHPAGNPATLQCFASEMQKVWKNTTKVIKDWEPSGSHPPTIKRPIHPTMPTQSLIGLKGTQSPASPLMMHDSDTLLTIKTMPSKRNKKIINHSDLIPARSRQDDLGYLKIDTSAVSRASQDSGHSSGASTFEKSLEEDIFGNNKFPKIINPGMTTNMITSIHPQPIQGRRRSLRAARPSRGATNGVRMAGHIIKELPPKYTRRTVVIPAPPPATPATSTGMDSLPNSPTEYLNDIIDQVQAANTPPHSAKDGGKRHYIIRLPEIQERSNMPLTTPCPSPSSGVGIFDSETDCDPQSDISSRGSASATTTIASEDEET